VTGHGLKTADVVSGEGYERRVEIDPSLRSFREKVSV